MKRRSAGIGILLAGLAACGGLGGPRTVVLSEQELQARIERAFPIQRRVLTAFDLRIAAPRLKLLPERDRVGAEMAVDVEERFYGATWRGRLDFDSGLRIDPREAALKLAGVRVAAFDIQSAGGALDPQLQRLGAGLAEQMLEGLVVWRPDEKQLERLRALGLEASTIHVTPRGIEIGLVPGMAR